MIRILAFILSILLSIIAGIYFFKSGSSEDKASFYENIYTAIMFELLFIVSEFFLVL